MFGNRNQLLGSQYVPPEGLEKYYAECMIRSLEKQMMDYIASLPTGAPDESD